MVVGGVARLVCHHPDVQLAWVYMVETAATVVICRIVIHDRDEMNPKRVS